jgi:dTDP-4-amino-4,6-dideoxygalactose transaminase
VLASGRYVLGSEVETFETAFASYCSAGHAVGVGNGLDALHLVLRAWGIGPGDEVIVPSNTYIATLLAVTMAGATPVPVESREATCNLDPDRIDAAVTPRTRVIIAVHLYGQPAEMGPIMAVAARHGLRVLEDAAQAHGARWSGRRTGALGHAAAWSFYPGKNLGAFGDAGAVTTSDDETANRVRMLGNYGSRRKYYNEVPGYNSRLDSLQAAVLTAKLPHLDAWNDRRRARAARYRAGLADCRGIFLPAVADDAEPVWHLYVIQTDRRDALQAHLSAAGVQTLIHYPVPPHRSEAYRSAPWASPPQPIAERLASRALSLPMGPHLTEAQQDRVIAAVRAFRW